MNIRAKNNRTGGFTIIETLVAITVLMISIAGPLSVASKGLTSALVSKDQMVATYLAQESMEYIKNSRDTNLAQGYSWLAGFDICNTQKCDASYLDLQHFKICGSSCDIYSGTNGYSHISGATTIFDRYFTLEKPDGTSGGCVENVGECQVVVVVKWNEGTTPYEVDLSSEITDAQK